MKWAGKGETQYSQDPHPRVGDPQMGGFTTAELLPRSTVSEPRIRPPSPGVLYWEDEPQNIGL